MGERGFDVVSKTTAGEGLMGTPCDVEVYIWLALCVPV